ncbi:YtzH-like family protein [Virgibacillus sp. MSJ-26]|uniref:YtzH-like family protein n=1 Tax=Virgibacillus sp. MSJ-26 TaxID=2841522 RepID=UPI001C0F661E|nr:YtzH-like family protein [Virgibacillus sp. MSJ-26]MBU5468610.1 YtzH-like family protein [Virgibacillus sp. MSJ-26]
MTLNVNHQLTLLYDLLDEHHAERDGEVAEYQQIKRVVKSMMANNSITNEQLLQLLPEIYNYGLKGESAQNSNEHIVDNQENIQQWISAINNKTLS